MRAWRFLGFTLVALTLMVRCGQLLSLSPKIQGMHYRRSSTRLILLVFDVQCKTQLQETLLHVFCCGVAINIQNIASLSYLLTRFTRFCLVLIKFLIQFNKLRSTLHQLCDNGRQLKRILIILIFSVGFRLSI